MSWFIRRANISAGGSSPTPPGPTPRLPQGFTELAYLETDGNCRILTGNTFRTNTDDVEADIYIANASASNYVFGCRSSATSRLYTLYTSNGNWIFGFGNSTNTGSAVSTGRHTAYINHVGGVLQIDGETDMSVGSATITTAYTPVLFALRAGSTYYYAEDGMRIYSFKLWRSGTLTRDLVPAMRDSDNAIGMYDIVGDVFRTNDGTGTLRYGSL